MSGFWTDEKAEEAKRLYQQGLSAEQIKRAIGASTRNQVIGKLARLGLTRGRIARTHGSRPASRPPKTPRPAAPPPTAAPEPPPRPPTPVPEPVLVDPERAKLWISRAGNECAYPVSGAGAETLSCGMRAVRGTYCAAHAKLMFRRPTAAETKELGKLRV